MRAGVRSAPHRLILVTLLAATLVKVAAAAKPPSGNPGGPPPTLPAVPRLQLLVPAYFYPSGDGVRMWNALGQAAKQVPVTAIFNPASGPGDPASGPDPRYTTTLDRARAAGVTLIGYVSTSYARRPLAVVQAEVDLYRRLYPQLRGIFFDEQASSAGHLAYYRTLYHHVKASHPQDRVITNPGTTTDSAYLTAPAADVACLFENKSGFDMYNPPPWLTPRFHDHAAALCYNVPDASAMRRHLALALARSFGWVYVTDDSGVNPWDRLPTYWAAEVAAIHALNSETAGPGRS